MQYDHCMEMKGEPNLSATVAYYDFVVSSLTLGVTFHFKQQLCTYALVSSQTVKRSIQNYSRITLAHDVLLLV